VYCLQHTQPKPTPNQTLQTNKTQKNPKTQTNSIIPLCLRHRLRKDPLADIDDGDRVRDVFKSVFGVE
jgi:hypothetical protein